LTDKSFQDADARPAVGSADFRTMPAIPNLPAAQSLDHTSQENAGYACVFQPARGATT
jgi:hypothetical protein